LVGCIFGLILTAVSAEEFRADPSVIQIRLTLDSGAQRALRQEPRAYVRAQIRLGDLSFSEVGVHLKGATGSFRSLDRTPSFTIDLDRFVPGQRFRGTSKIHLNNAVEDPSYLSEWLGGEVFAAAGIPTPAISHALVWLGDRRLGLYVLKEGYTDEFLHRFSLSSGGRILEPDPTADIEGGMRWKAGTRGPSGGLAETLETLSRAVREPDLDRRWEQLQSALEVELFLTFQALEVLLGHRDGYTLARNNFRLLIPPEGGRVVFLPHGMDQLFQPTDLPWNPHCAGLVARALQETPEGRRRYAERCRRLFAELFAESGLTNRIQSAVDGLAPFLNAAEATEVAKSAQELSARVVARVASLRQQFAEPEVASLDFSLGEAGLTGWTPQDRPEEGRLQVSTGPDGVPVLGIRAGPVPLAWWRTTVKLEPGRYRYEGRVRTAGVRSLPFGRNQGARLRVSGDRPPSVGCMGDSDGRILSLEFSVAATGEEVRLFCELRASTGESWFETGSLRLRKLE